jgi:hypothetical protein
MIEFCFGETLLRGVPKVFNREWGCLLDVAYLLILTMVLQLPAVGDFEAQNYQYTTKVDAR